MAERLKLKLQKEGESWHAKTAGQTLSLLESDLRHGLSEEEAAARQETFGRNILPDSGLPSRLAVFLRQFKSPFILILLAGGIIAFAIHEFVDGAVIAGAMLLNSVIGYVQEYRATRALAELQKAVRVRAAVLRGGKEREVDQEELVPGDVVLLEAGRKVPADGRILETEDLKATEAQLTGEWLASEKRTDTLPLETPLADRENMAYMGSVVMEGNGLMAVTGTGREAEIGKVAQLVQGVHEELTPYQARLHRFSALVAAAVLLLAAGIFGLGLAAGREAAEIFTTAIAIAVSAVPEGLPIAVTVVLAIGMQRILKQNGLVRRLAAAETLGSATVIATDKTLTLTEGRMEVDSVFAKDEARALLAAGAANEAYREESGALRGRPTDQALLEYALRKGVRPAEFRQSRERARLIPFTSKTKYAAFAFQERGRTTALFSGAPEPILERSKLAAAKLQEFTNKLEELASRGLRVVAVAEGSLPAGTPDADLLRDVVPVGLIALKDPVRKGVKEAISQARKAGVATIMVTGDHARTAQAVAREVGIPAAPKNVMEGKDLDLLSEAELSQRLPKLTVYARVEPAHKLRIVQAWQAAGHTIAMTGDGVNDAPALKKADIGVALGSGTDVAKETADLVLLGDNFTILPAAIREGRVITANIRKIITYLLSGSFTETVLIVAALALGWPLPVLAAQILWVNLVEDSLPAIALTLEKGRKDVMELHPEKKSSPMLTGEMKAIIFGIGIATDFLLLAVFAWLFLASSLSLEHIRSIVFVGLGIGSLLYVFSVKNLSQNIWKYSLLDNAWLAGAVLAGFALLGLAIYAPPLQLLFHTVPLGLLDWILLFGLGIINVLLIELVKWLFIKTNNV